MDELACRLDVEVTDGLAPPALQAGISTWLEAVQAACSCTPIVYTDPSFWRKNCAGDFSVSFMACLLCGRTRGACDLAGLDFLAAYRPWKREWYIGPGRPQLLRTFVRGSAATRRSLKPAAGPTRRGEAAR